MTLSPFEVERREFASAPMGYKKRDVDAFVDEVHRSLAQLWQDRSDMREENERLKERLARFEQIEDQLKNTLLLAQDSAEKAHEQARRESDLVMREAGQKARDIVHHAHEDKQRVEMVLRDLVSAEQEARQRLRAMSAAIVSHLDDTEQLVNEGPVHATQLRAKMQAQPEATLRPTTTESLVIAPEDVDKAVADAEFVATATREVERLTEDVSMPAHTPEEADRRGRLRDVASSETADAFFDAPPSFGTTEVAASRRSTETPSS